MKEKRQNWGFATWDKAKLREVAAKAGRASHNPGPGQKFAHEWTREEAKQLGRKGGLASQANRRKRLAQEGANDGKREAGVSDAQ